MKNCLTQINPFLVVFAAVILLTAYPVSGQDVISTGDEIPYSKDTYTYKIVDNHEIQADVYQYPAKEVRPVIIWIHPGALIFGDRSIWLSSEQLVGYLKAGYTVVSIDHRLAPETKLAAIIEDLEDAHTWVRTKGPDLFKIDPDRIAVVGHSAGGYLTLMAGFRLKPRPSALVSFYGYGDITALWYTRPDSFYNQMPPIPRDQAIEFIGDSTVSNPPAEPSWPNGRAKFYIYCRQQGLWSTEVSGHDPEKDVGWFSEYEPLSNVSPAYPPTLLLHGEKDTDVPFEQSILMAKAFEQHGVEYEFITNPDWGHMFDFFGMEDSAVQKSFGQVLTFLVKHVR